jgi:DNA topoisomerase 2-associated protein PAT1
MLTALTLLVACFSQMDIIIHARILDLPEENIRQQDLERQTQAFLGSVIQSILPVVAKAGLRLVSGLLGLLLERSDIISIAQTRVCSYDTHADQLRLIAFPTAWPGHSDTVS